MKLLVAVLTVLASPPPPEGVTPESGFAAAGDQGGPFSPPAMTYTLTNGVEYSVKWTAVGAQPWLTIAPPCGVLSPGASVAIAIGINETANALPPGQHADDIAFEWLVLRGDMNGDTRVDANDVPLFSAVAAGANTDTDLFRVADMDENGVVDGRDVTFFVLVATGNL